MVAQGAGGYINYVNQYNWFLAYINQQKGYYDATAPQNAPFTPSNQWTMFVLGYDLGAQLTPYSVNGSTRTSTSDAGGVSDTIRTDTMFLNGNNSTSSGNGELADVMFFNESLSTAEVQTVEGYLAQKWGLQSILPSNHPYKSTAPTLTPAAVTVPVIKNMSVTLVSNVPRLTWTGISGASTRIYRDFQPSGATKALVTTVAAGTSTYDDSTAVGGQTYYYFLAPVTPSGAEGTLVSFTPLSGFSSLTLWYDGADPLGTGTAPVNGAAIALWADKSGYGKNAEQATAGNRPTYQASSLNGRGTIRFAGATTLQYLDTPAFEFGTSNRTVFVVLQNTGPASGAASIPHWFFPKTGNGTNSLSLVGWISASNQGAGDTFSITPAKNQYLLVGYRLGTSAGVQQLYTNGTLGASLTKSIGGTSYANAMSGYRIGYLVNDPFAPYQFDGNIAEMLIFNATLTDSQLQLVEGYLAQKWGLQSNLPATHPYKSVGPSANSIAVTLSTYNFPPSAMTGNSTTLSPTGFNAITAGTYVASASSIFSTSYDAWKGFNKDSSTENQGWNTANSLYNTTTGAYTGSVTTTVSGQSYAGEWLQLQMPIAIVLTQYSLTCRIYEQTTQSPRQFLIAGSNDGTTWTLVDSRSDQNSWAENNRTLTYTVSSSNAYRYYRYICQVSGFGNPQAHVAELVYTGRIGVNTPSNAVATALGTKGIQLNWTNLGLNYKLYRDTVVTGATKTLINTVTGSSYVDSSAMMGTTQYYFLTAADGTQESPLTNALFARQDAALDWIAQTVNSNTTGNDVNPKVTVDSSGNVIAAYMVLNGLASGGTATGQWEVILFKYSSSGALLWVKQNQSFQTNNEDAPLCLTTDASNNIIMTMYTYVTMSGGVSAGAYEGAVVKFDANGNTLWVLHNTLFNTSGWDNATRAIVDPSGTIYVAGLVQGAISGGGPYAGSEDTYLMKVTAAGQIVWTRQLRSMNTSGSDIPTGLGLDASGNVYMSYNTGGAVSGGVSRGSSDVAFAKFDSGGNLIWLKQHTDMNSSLGESNGIHSIVVDKTNQCFYSTYISSGAVSGGTNLANNVGDVVVAKLDLNGALIWIKQIPNVINTASAEASAGIVLDRFGYPIIAYTTDGTISGGTSAGSTDVVLAQFDPSGNVVWTYQKPILNTSGADTQIGLGYDPDGYIVGAYQTGGTVSGGVNKGGSDLAAFRVMLGSDLANSTPTGLTAAASPSTGVRVSWTSRGLKYLVYRDTVESGATKQLLGFTYNSYYDDTSASTSTIYYYFVSSMYGTSESALVSALYSGSSPTVPAAPTNVSATVGDKQATLSWTLSSDNGRSPILSQTVTSNPGNIRVVVGAQTTSATITGLVNGYSYTFTVTANNAIGSSAPSMPSNAETYTDPAIAAAVEAAASSPAAIDTYVASQTTKTAAELYLALRGPIQAASLGTAAELQFIDSIAGKNGSTVLSLDSTQSDFIRGSLGQVATDFVAVKPTVVVLPTFSSETNSATVPIGELGAATSGTSYLQIEVPVGKTIVLEDPSGGSKALSFDGTQFSDGQKTYGLNSVIVIGRRLFRIVGIGSMLLEPQDMGLRGIMLGSGMRLLGQGVFVVMGAAETTY